jgi:HAD superfamily hydrolase (TIGR01450 family)
VTLDAAHACVVDLDGVVWLGDEFLPGAVEGVALLRRRGIPVLFATNNATPTVDALLAKLRDGGIDAYGDEVATSAQAAASLVGRGSRVFAVGEDGLLEALARAGATVSDEAPDAVVVGLLRAFDYAVCDRAAALVRDGARFVATNTDPTLPTAGGLHPGAGAIVAAIATAAGREPEVAGKPHPAMVRLVTSRGAVGAVIGDRASTDGAFAEALGVPFALVRSEVGESGERAAVRATSLLEAVRGLCR